MTTLFRDNNKKYIFPSNENKQFKNTGVGFSTQKIIKDIKKDEEDDFTKDGIEIKQSQKQYYFNKWRQQYLENNS